MGESIGYEPGQFRLSRFSDGYRVIAIMDEPFKWTNIKDAFDASLAMLTRFCGQGRPRFHGVFKPQRTE
jgi:hypothetical protein